MEIRTYARILWRWLWLVAGLPALVLVLSLSRLTPPPGGYSATMRFSVGVVPQTPAGPGGYYTYDHYYSWLTAEYVTDDLAEIVKSREVADAVIAEAKARGLTVELAPGAIQGATSGGKLHRILTVSLGWHNRDELQKLAEATAAVLSEGKTPYFAKMKSLGTPILMYPIDPPSISPVGISLRSRLDVPLRLALALVAGVSLAFFLEYLDDTVRDPRDLRAQGLTVLGIIPRRGKMPWSERGER
ncbi:MAG: YveK family protein [Anaerolineae bacterium]